jgi:hypothetical protein
MGERRTLDLRDRPVGSVSVPRPDRVDWERLSVRPHGLIGVAHLKVEEQSIEGLKAIAYRAIENTSTSSAYGVGMPVQVAVVTKDGVEEMHEGEPSTPNSWS